ncbi:Nrap protein [Hesseltinella vesiculosa]|uniref:U3 small nucleolar RNA-associated protein 22 n=1 Tax=Hesseltinella vesiculosa TaxID=101127 RepID=A0A1X2G4A5_9FUNG|nr:Nrap protein [Hesseltinella vesiculosa]
MPATKRKLDNQDDQLRKKVTKNESRAYESDSDNGDWESQSDDDSQDGHVTMREKPKHQKDDMDVQAGELEGLQETAALYKSNIFKLEIDELLNEVRLGYDKMKPLDKALHTIKDILDKIPEDKKDLLLTEYAASFEKKHKIKVPFPQPAPSSDAQYKFKFSPPTSTHVVGSFALKTAIKSKQHWNVDIAVEMPESTFQEKDSINYRYFYKRACYLAVLANAIKSSKKGFSVEYGYLNGDVRKPILLIHPPQNKSDLDFTKTKAVIRIIPCISESVFAPARLGPARNSVRPKEEKEPYPATPQYNASILQDTSYTTLLAYLYQQSKQCEGFRDAVLLGKTWLYQRGLASTDQTNGGWNSFLFSMIMAYLLQGNDASKKLSSGHSSYQLLRGTLDFLATHDFTTDPVFLGRSEHEDLQPPLFQQNYDVVVVDPSGTFNLAAHVTKSGLAQVQYEARVAMTSLNDTVDRFESLFLKNVNQPDYRFDHVAKLRMSDKHIKQYDANTKLDYPYYPQFYAKRIGSILSRGLTNRADLVSVQYTLPAVTWALDSTNDLDQGIEGFEIIVGLILNPDTCHRLVDQGPDAQDKNACVAFDAFWGSKAELRRFKDGSILDSVVWETQGYENKTLIVEKMVRYLLNLHLAIPSSQITYRAGQLYQYIHYAKSVPVNLVNQYKLSVVGFQPVMNAFTQFAKQLRSIDDELPLLISNVYPVSSSLRQASVTLPSPVEFANIDTYPSTFRYIPAMDVTVQLERSHKWPSDIVAMQKVKHAFHLKIAEQFQTKFHVTCAVVDDVDETNPFAARGHLDVYYHGFVFRCHLFLEQEQELLTRLADTKPSPLSKVSLTSPERLLAKQALHQHTVLFQHRREHTFNIQKLCARFPAFSTTMRLVKRWFGAHMLSAQVPEEIIELLCASVFLDPLPFTAPVSPYTGFARTMALIASWDWPSTPLVVDIEEEMTAADRETAAQAFEQQRLSASAKSMVIATAQDLHGARWWSSGQASPGVIARLQSLAHASCTVLCHSARDKDLLRMFVTPMTDYNVVFQLDSSRCTRYFQGLRPQGKYMTGVEMSELGSQPFAELDTVSCLVRDIQKTYGSSVMVFYDKYGGDKLALVWNPFDATPRPWKVNADYNALPVDMSKTGYLKPTKDASLSKLAAPNFNAITAEIERLGDGLISKIC